MKLTSLFMIYLTINNCLSLDEDNFYTALAYATDIRTKNPELNQINTTDASDLMDDSNSLDRSQKTSSNQRDCGYEGPTNSCSITFGLDTKDFMVIFLGLPDCDSGQIFEDVVCIFNSDAFMAGYTDTIVEGVQSRSRIRILI